MDSLETGAPQPAGEQAERCAYYVTYTGVKMPFKLVEHIPEAQLNHRNTFIRAYFDAAGGLTGFDKMVYGEIELAHRYSYHDNGQLRRAEVTMVDEDPVVLCFDAQGAPVAQA